MANKKKYTFEEILELYTIKEDELQQVFRSFGLKREGTCPSNLLKELIKVSISAKDKTITANQEAYSWFRHDWTPAVIRYGKATWITKSDFKVIDRMAVPVSKGSTRSVEVRDGVKITNTKSLEKRFDITILVEMTDYKK